MTSSDYPIRKHFKCCPFSTSCIIATCFGGWEGIFHTTYWPGALTCLLQIIWYIIYSLHKWLRVLGCSAKQQDGSILPSHHHCSASPAQWERWQGTALVADHLTNKFPVIQRRPELPFPLHSIPGIASRAPRAGDNTGTAKHCLSSALREGLQKSVPKPEPSPGHSCAGGVTEQTQFIPNPCLD